MEIQIDSSNIEVEEESKECSKNFKKYQQNCDLSTQQQLSLISGQIINEDSQEYLFKDSNGQQSYCSIQSDHFQDQSISMNDLIFEKMRRIQFGTYRQEDFAQIEATLKQKMEVNNSRNISSLNSSSRLEWNDTDLIIQENQSTEKKDRQNKQIQKFQKQSFKSHPITHIFIKELESTNIFYLIGNVIIDFNAGVYFNKNIQSIDFYDTSQLKESRAVNSAIKQIVRVENNFKNQEISVHMQLNVKPLEDFSFITKFIQENSYTELSKQMGIYLEFYQKSVATQQKGLIKRAIKRAEELDYNFPLLLQERQKFLKKCHEDTLQEFQLNNTGFYCASYYCADFNSEDLTLSNFSYSYPLIAFLGFEPNQFQSGVSKKGISMWISPYTRSLIQITFLKDWLSINEGQSLSVNEIDPFCIKTLDEMMVVTKAKRVRKLVNYEGPLAYIFEGIADSVNLLVLDIDLFTIKRIISMRKDYFVNQKAAQFIDDFEYNIQSQIFLEKYYSDQYEEYLVEQQKIQKINEKKQIEDSKVCSYRYINQSNQNQEINTKK